MESCKKVPNTIAQPTVFLFIFFLFCYFTYILFVDIVAVSETDGEEDENVNDNQTLVETCTSKPEPTHDSFTSSAFKNISTFLSSHMGSHSNPSTSSNKNKT